MASSTSTLRGFGSQFQILPERTAPLASFRNRNVILLGDGLNSFAAAKLLGRARLAVVLDSATGRLVIRERARPASESPAFSRHESGPGGGPAEVYGLLTVFPTDAEPGKERRTLIYHGAFRLRQDGLPGFPSAYQVVVKCTAEDSLLLSCGYAAHYILP